jgi:hypothetical protein
MKTIPQEIAIPLCLLIFAVTNTGNASERMFFGGRFLQFYVAAHLGKLCLSKIIYLQNTV